MLEHITLDLHQCEGDIDKYILDDETPENITEELRYARAKIFEGRYRILHILNEGARGVRIS